MTLLSPCLDPAYTLFIYGLILCLHARKVKYVHPVLILKISYVMCHEFYNIADHKY